MDVPGGLFDTHLAAAIGVLVEHASGGVAVRRDGVAVVAVGKGGAAFNTGWVVGQPSKPEATVGWLRETLAAVGQPYCVHVPGPFVAGLAPALAAAGLAFDVTLPAMSRATTGAVPPLPPGARVARVTDEAALEAHAVAVAVGFGAPDPRGAVPVLVPSLLADDRVAMVNGYLDGSDEPCATAVCVVTGGIAGIYAVTVHDAVRRRGLGTAVTWAAVAAGHAAGARVTALQATAMGEPVYRRMGFTAFREYHRYAPA